MVLKKKFFDVSVPIIGEETELLAYELGELDGKHIKLDLTRALKGKSVELQTRVILEGEKAVAIPLQLTVLPSYLRRAVRKGTNYVEDSFILECKDSTLRIKPFLVTRKKVSRRVRAVLREKTKEELMAFSRDKTAEEMFEDILKNKLQKSLSLTLKKIYPLSFCEIRVLQLIKKHEASSPSNGSVVEKEKHARKKKIDNSSNETETL